MGSIGLFVRRAQNDHYTPTQNRRPQQKHKRRGGIFLKVIKHPREAGVKRVPNGMRIWPDDSKLIVLEVWNFKIPRLPKLCINKQVNRMHKPTYLYLQDMAAEESKHVCTYGPSKV